MSYYRPTPEQHRAMFPDGDKVNSVRSLCAETAIGLGFAADLMSDKGQMSGAKESTAKEKHAKSVQG